MRGVDSTNFVEFGQAIPSNIVGMKFKPALSCFGKRLREARLRVGIAQDRLGVEIGLDEGTASARISRYETGVHEPPFDIARKIASVLQIPIAYFYCDDDELSAVIAAWAAASVETKVETKALLGLSGGLKD